jgi:hypothetical protein
VPSNDRENETSAGTIRATRDENLSISQKEKKFGRMKQILQVWDDVLWNSQFDIGIST